MALKNARQWNALRASPARKAMLPVIAQAAAQVAQETGVPVDTLRTALDVMAAKESGYDPKRMNKESGASGLFQYIPTTANALGINPLDAAQASLAAARDAAKAFQRGGIAEVFKSHFAGPGGSGRGEKTREYALDALNGMNAFGMPAFAPGVRRGTSPKRVVPPDPLLGDAGDHELQTAEDTTETTDPLADYAAPAPAENSVLAMLSKYPVADIPLPKAGLLQAPQRTPVDAYETQRDPRTLAYFEQLIANAPDTADA